MAATKSAGRVSIRVLPDSTRFKQDLKKSLERIERTTQVKIPVELEVTRAQLAKLKREIEALVIKIKPTIDLQLDQTEIDAMKARIEAMRPRVNVDLDTNRAAARMAVLSRTRDVKFRPVLDNAATRLFLAKLRALSGLNVVGDMFRTGKEFFLNIDRNAVKFAGLITKFGALTSIIGSLGQSLFVMGGNLASLANIGIVAPAFITGMGVAIGVLSAALKDTKTVLADLGPTFSRWQDTISADFWKEAAQPIRDVVNALMPILVNGNGTNTARSLGKFVAEMANGLRELLTADKLNLMLDRMNNSIDILSRAIRPLTNAFINLGIVGSGYFERFSNWIVKLSDQFNNFIQTNMDNGNLDRWIENAITNFKALGNAIRGAVRILNSIHTAAVRAGALNLTNFADALNKAADAMNGDRFQNTLTTIFEGMNKAVEGVGRGLRALGPAIESAAPSISRVLGTVGDIAEKIGGLLAKVIENPVLQAGVEHFAQSISTSMDILAPAATPFAESLGQIFELMGKILPKVAELVTAITVKWGPIFDSMGKSLAELIDPLGNSLQKFVDKMTPALQDFDTHVVKPLVKFLKEEGIPFLDKAVEQLGPAFSAAFKEIGRFIREDLTPLFENLNKLLDKLKGANVNLADIFKLPDWLANPKNVMPGFQGGWLMPGGAERFQQDWDNFWRPINDWWVNTAWPGVEKWLLGELKKFEDWSNNEFGPAVQRTIDGMIKGFWGWVNDMIFGNEEPPEWKGSLFGWIGERIKKAWDNDMKRLDQWWKDTKKNFQKWFKSLFGFGGTDNLDNPAKIIDGGGMGTGGASRSPGAKIMPLVFDETSELSWLDGLKIKLATKWAETFGGITTAFNTFKTLFSPSWATMLTETETGTNNTTTNIGLTFATKLAEWGLGFDTFKTNALMSWGIWGAETLKGTQETMGGSDTSITEKTTNMAATLAGWIATNQPAWVTAFNLMKDGVVNNMTGSNDSTTTNLASMAATVATKLQEIKDNWGPGWTTVSATLKTAWDIMTGHTQTGVQNNANEAGKLPQKAKDSIGDTRTTLLASGAALVSGFAQGMNNNLGLVENAAISVAAMVAKHMPHSPAKAGPLSGLGYTTWSGKALVEDFAGGMMDRMSNVRKASAALAGAASIAANDDFNADLDNNGVVIDRSQVILHTYNPVAEPTSRTIEKNANNIRMAKGL